jgi:hypothetical protein
MSLCRDSIASLWPASYQGVSFLFKIVDKVGVASLKVRDFPERDSRHADGRYERRRSFEGFAYVTADQAEAAENVESLARQGVGTLAVPILGPVQIRCDAFKRCAEGDRLGYVCFAVKLVRVVVFGASAPVSRSPHSVFEAADGLAAALIRSFPDSLSLENGIDCVIGAVRAIETIAASIELVRTTTLVEPDISVQVEAAIAAITSAAPLMIAPLGAAADVANLLAVAPPLDATYSDPTATLAAVVVATIRLLCVGTAGNDDGGAGALLELALDYPAATNSEPVSADSAAAAANSACIVDLVRVAALTAWCESSARRSYASCSDAIATHASAEDRLAQELDHAASAGNLGLHAAIQRLQSAIVQYLSQVIVDLTPVVSRPARLCGRALAGVA